jgi:NtrC-family two-component system response regulator AlgB
MLPIIYGISHHMSPALPFLQSKLLRFIETKKYRVLGEPQERTSDVRILAATNRDLKQLISEKKFREDLFYRLNIQVLSIPPLRDREEDIKVVVK